MKRMIILVIILVSAFALTACGDDFDFPPQPDPFEINAEPYMWFRDAALTPYAILEVRSQTEESYDFSCGGGTVGFAKCVCDVLYYGVKTYDEYLDFVGDIYVPDADRENFAPGERVLVGLHTVRASDGGTVYIPFLGEDRRAEFIPFVDGLLASGNDLGGDSFHALREINGEIVSSLPAAERTGWRSHLPEYPLEDGMTVAEVRDFFEKTSRVTGYFVSESERLYG